MADGLLKQGLAFLQENNSLSALACFERAYAVRKTPLVQSYLAVCIATHRGQISEAVSLCLEAIAQEPQETVHYLNLGKVYIKAGKKKEALDILRQGLSRGENPELRELLERIGVRRKPLFPFLSRENFLNRYIGLVLSRLGLR